MHTFLTRANALAAYTMSVLAGLTMVCFLSTFFLDYRTGSKINTVKVVVKHVPDYSASREKVRFLQKNCQDSSLGETPLFSFPWLFYIYSNPCLLISLQNDLGFLTFDLQADLTPLFNWNVKQLFLYLTAEYETQANVVNQVVLWDKIIQRGENAVLDYRWVYTMDKISG